MDCRVHYQQRAQAVAATIAATTVAGDLTHVPATTDHHPFLQDHLIVYETLNNPHYPVIVQRLHPCLVSAIREGGSYYWWADINA